MYDRAIKIYERQREQKGIQRRDIGKPKEVFHAHIDAMDDHIEIQRYGLGKNRQIYEAAQNTGNDTENDKPDEVAELFPKFKHGRTEVPQRHLSPISVKRKSSLAGMGSAQEAIDDYQSSTSGQSASGRDDDSEWEGPASLAGLYMGQSAPLGKKDVEDVSLQALVAETPLIQLKKAKLGKATDKAAVYRMQREQKA